MYGGIHLNTVGIKILADNFILGLSQQTSLRISKEKDATNEGTPVTESEKPFPKYCGK